MSASHRRAAGFSPKADVAVIQNSAENVGGAERVGLTLARELDADMYTTNVDIEKVRLLGFPGVRIESIGRVPANAPLRQEMNLRRFRGLKLGGRYGRFIISGDWAMYAALNNRPNIWYAHSPIREVWDLYRHTRESSVHPLVRPAYDAWVGHHRRLNLNAVKHVDTIVCNSRTTQARIRDYFGIEARVIYPPVETDSYVNRRCGDYWLSVNRLMPYKRVELQVKAFSRMPDKRLIIVGEVDSCRKSVKYAQYLSSIRPSNVEFMSLIGQERLIDMYSRCRGLIATSIDEDLGLNALEAMAAGKPVVAPRQGGYAETVLDGVTGRLFDGPGEEPIIKAVEEVDESPESYRRECSKRAERFDVKAFMGDMREELARL